MTRRPTRSNAPTRLGTVVLALTLATVLVAVGADGAAAAPSPEVNSVTAYGVADLGPPGAQQLADPVVGIAPTPTGDGYWLVATDGGVFTYGDATFHGSAGNIDLSAPITGIAPTPTGDGYWLVATDGGVFTYGDAAFLGSTAGQSRLGTTAITADPDGFGYWLLRRDGQIDGFGADDLGDPATIDPDFWPLHPSIAMAAAPQGGYWVAHGVPVLLDEDDQGGAVLAVERRLDELGYWVGIPDRTFDGRTNDAVIAFQKHERLAVDGVVGPSTLQAIDAAAPARAVTTAGDALEVDRARALVYVVVDGATRWVLNAETGATSTPLGTYAVVVALDGDVASSPFGPMNRPLMFTVDGNAIAGSDEPLEIGGTTAGAVLVSDASIGVIWDEGTGAPGTPVVIRGS